MSRSVRIGTCSKLVTWRISFSENRCPPSDQVRGQAFPGYALAAAAVSQHVEATGRLRLAEFLGLLVPGARLAHVGLDPANAEAREHARIIGCAERERCDGVAGLRRPLEDEARGDEVAGGDELLALLDQQVDLGLAKLADRGRRRRLL